MKKMSETHGATAAIRGASGLAAVLAVVVLAAAAQVVVAAVVADDFDAKVQLLVRGGLVLED